MVEPRPPVLIHTWLDFWHIKSNVFDIIKLRYDRIHHTPNVYYYRTVDGSLPLSSNAIHRNYLLNVRSRHKPYQTGILLLLLFIMCRVYFYFHCSQAHFQRWLDHFRLPSRYIHTFFLLASTVFYHPNIFFYARRHRFLYFPILCVVHFQSIQLISWISQATGWLSWPSWLGWLCLPFTWDLLLDSFFSLSSVRQTKKNRDPTKSETKNRA